MWDSWSWQGHEGKPIEVEIYSRYPKVRLYLNEQLIGEQSTGREQEFKAVFSVPYSPGTLKAVGVENGQEVEAQELATAGEPAQIRLTADRTVITADGQDLSFVTVEILDKEGRVNPNAENRLTFEVNGAGVIAAVGNANLKDTDCYVGNTCNTWKGRAIVVLKSTKKNGTIKLKATSNGLRSATVSVKTRK